MSRCTLVWNTIASKLTVPYHHSSISGSNGVKRYKVAAIVVISTLIKTHAQYRAIIE